MRRKRRPLWGRVCSQGCERQLPAKLLKAGGSFEPVPALCMKTSGLDRLCGAGSAPGEGERPPLRLRRQPHIPGRFASRGRCGRRWCAVLNRISIIWRLQAEGLVLLACLHTLTVGSERPPCARRGSCSPPCSRAPDSRPGSPRRRGDRGPFRAAEEPAANKMLWAAVSTPLLPPLGFSLFPLTPDPTACSPLFISVLRRKMMTCRRFD